MISVKIDGVDIYNPIKNREKEIIDLFVSYYGEEHRELITDKINNTTFIFTPRNPGFEGEAKGIGELYDKIIKLGVNSMLSACGKRNGSVSPNFDFNNCSKYIKALKEGYCFEDEIEGVWEIAKVYNINSIIEKRSLNSFKKWINNVDNKNTLLEYLNKIEYWWNLLYKDYIQGSQNEKNAVLQQLQPYENKKIKLDKSYDEELKKIACKFILKHKEKDKELTDSLLLQYATLWKTLVLYNTKYTDFAFYSKQISPYIPLFNLLGYSYEDVKDYKNQQLYNLIYKSPEATLLNKKVFECEVLRHIENPYIKDAFKKLEKLDIEGGDFLQAKNLLGFVNIKSTMGGYATSYLDKTSKKQKNLCVLGNSITSTDDELIHEVNHIVESVVIPKEGGCVVNTGWDSYTVDYYDMDYSTKVFWDYTRYYKMDVSPEARPHMVLNEILNEYITSQILEIAKSKKLKFCLDRNEFLRNVYACAFPAIANFFKHHKEAIIESRLKGDIGVLIDYMGADVFANFEEMVKMYYDLAYKENWLKQMVYEIQTTAEQKIDLNNYEEFIYLEREWPKNAQHLINIFTNIDIMDRYVSLKHGKQVEMPSKIFRSKKQSEENETEQIK